MMSRVSLPTYFYSNVSFAARVVINAPSNPSWLQTIFWGILPFKNAGITIVNKDFF
jgi:hypothetical protein